MTARPEPGAPRPHTYATAGTYAVTLTVTDNEGATSQATRMVTATVPAPGERDGRQRPVHGDPDQRLGRCGGRWLVDPRRPRRQLHHRRGRRQAGHHDRRLDPDQRAEGRLDVRRRPARHGVGRQAAVGLGLLDQPARPEGGQLLLRRPHQADRRRQRVAGRDGELDRDRVHVPRRLRARHQAERAGAGHRHLADHHPRQDLGRRLHRAVRVEAVRDQLRRRAAEPRLGRPQLLRRLERAGASP